MFQLRSLALATVFMAATAVVTSFGYAQKIVEDDAYNRMVTIMAYVEILNNPELEERRQGQARCSATTGEKAGGRYKDNSGRLWLDAGE